MWRDFQLIRFWHRRRMMAIRKIELCSNGRALRQDFNRVDYATQWRPLNQRRCDGKADVWYAIAGVCTGNNCSTSSVQHFETQNSHISRSIWYQIFAAASVHGNGGSA